MSVAESCFYGCVFCGRSVTELPLCVDWLTVLHSITLVDLQLDAQNSCLFTYLLYICIHWLTSAQDSHLQRVTIPEAAYIQL